MLMLLLQYMKELENKIIKEGKILEGDILRIDNFLNHQIDTKFLDEIAISGSSPGTKAVQSVRSKLAEKQTELNIENISDMLVF